jgi:serine/threonine-protein kinase
VLKKEKRLAERRAIQIALQVCAGVYAAHVQGIVHRDLKPENIIIQELPDGAMLARVLDFSIAKFTQREENSDDDITGDQELLGTYRYMAPEQFSGATIDARTDVFSMCLIIYEMLTGTVACAAMADITPLRKVRPDILPALHTIIHRGLSRDPQLRPTSVLDLKRDLEACEPLAATEINTDAPERSTTPNITNTNTSTRTNAVGNATNMNTAAGDSLHGVWDLDELPTLQPGSLIANYHILECIGQGDMGEVYLAEDKRLGRQVALKIVPNTTDNLERMRHFEVEARAASALNHPNILTIYEVGHTDMVSYIAAEYVAGKNLRDRLREGLRLAEALDIALQVASALATAHPAGIIHRNLRPENIRVRPDGYVKILNFGMAKILNDKLLAAGTPIDLRRSLSGQLRGNPRYIAPEQARGVTIDARADIFSLGVIIYEMVTGLLPFTGATKADVIAAVLNAPARPLSTYIEDPPPELQQILDRALAKDREIRYQTANDLWKDLKEFRQLLEVEWVRSTAAEDPRVRWLQTTGGIVTTPPVSVAWWRATPLALAATLILGIVLTVAALSVYRMATKVEVQQARRIAILPFLNLNQNKEADFLSASLADAVSSRLAYVQSLVVRPSLATSRYRNQTVNPEVVARELQVDTLVTGSFLKEDDNLQISAQLIDLKDNKVIWQDTWQLKYDKIITVQNRVSNEIVDGLKLNLSDSEAERLQAQGKQKPEAYEYYLRGRNVLSTSVTQFEVAREFFEKSVELDPSYPLAWTYLAYTYAAGGTSNFGGRIFYDKAQKAYEKALLLDPEQLEARILGAVLLTDTGQIEKAAQNLRSVLERNPNNALAHWNLSYTYRYAGMLKESIVEGEKALNIDPLVVNRTLNTYIYEGLYQKFLATLPPRQDEYFVFYRGLAQLYLNNRDEAQRLLNLAYEKNSNLIFTQVGRAMSYAIAGDNSAGLALLQECEAKAMGSGVIDGEAVYKIAQAYSLLGDKMASIQALRKSIENGFFCYPYMARDPLLQNLQSDPEFQKVLRLAQQRHEVFKARFFKAT